MTKFRKQPRLRPEGISANSAERNSRMLQEHEAASISSQIHPQLKVAPDLSNGEDMAENSMKGPKLLDSKILCSHHFGGKLLLSEQPTINQPRPTQNRQAMIFQLQCLMHQYKLLGSKRHGCRISQTPWCTRMPAN